MRSWSAAAGSCGSTPDAKRASDDSGASYEYGTLLLATGGRPRRLGDAPDDVVYFRTFDDYRRLRGLADRGAGFLVVGGGFIGSEIAAALRMQDREVTLVLKGEGIGEGVYPPELSRWLVDYYRGKGVTVQTGKTVERVESRNGKLQIPGRPGSLWPPTWSSPAWGSSRTWSWPGRSASR